MERRRNKNRPLLISSKRQGTTIIFTAVRSKALHILKTGMLTNSEGQNEIPQMIALHLSLHSLRCKIALLFRNYII